MTVAKAGPPRETVQRARIGQARRFIRAHATEPLTLERIAREASVSAFHFARLFRALTGETVFAFVTRVRLKAAVTLLLDKPSLSVTDVAMAVGYDAAPSFNKLFKKTFGTTPTRFRALPALGRAALLACLEDPDMSPATLDLASRPEFRVRPDREFLFVGRRGSCPEEAPLAWAEFHRIVAGSGVLGPDMEFVGASYDDTGPVKERSHRYEAGITVPDGTPAPRGLTRRRLPGGRYAIFRYRGSYAHIGRAFDAIFSGWVTQSGTLLRSAPCLEIYLNDPRTVAPENLLTDLCVPVEDSTAR